MAVTTIHLLHHTHHDLGYTDLPAECLELHVDYVRQALDAAEADLHRPEEERFRWTCEALAPVVELVRREPAQQARIRRLVAAGSIEVCALPWGLSTHLTGPEWDALRALHRSWWRAFACTAAMQNDINGLSWGLIPGLAAAGIRHLCMAPNGYAGGWPQPPPAAWRWEGPDGASLVTWMGPSYDAYRWFHATEWRRGPVPAAHDPWFHPPGPEDTWPCTPEALDAAHARLTASLAARAGHWPHAQLALQVTNQWRMDNDPPAPHLAAFVRAWNAAGLVPRLEMSTPTRFLDRLAAGADLPVRRGDWCDWWADGLPALGRELALGQRAKRRLAALPAAAAGLGVAAPGTAAAWELSQGWSEHTFASYDRAARPWSDSSQGQEHALLALPYRLDARSRALRRALLAGAADARPSAHAAAAAVLCPEGAVPGGWVELPAAALPAGSTGLEGADGLLHPFEPVVAAEWSDPDPARDQPAPLGVPAGIWGFHVTARRAWVPGPGRYALSQRVPAAPAATTVEGEDATWRWRWDGASGALRSLMHRASGSELVDAAAAHAVGALVWRRARGPAAYAAVTGRDAALPARWDEAVPPACEAELVAGAYGFHARWRRRHAAWRDAEQELRLLPDGAIELTTRVWMHACEDPHGLWLALPLAPAGSTPSYDALGHETRPGFDQLPGSCGEHLSAGRGLALRTAALALVLDTTDTPVLSLGPPAPRSGRRAGIPASPHPYPCLLASWWSTNFPVGRAQLIETVHVLRPGPPGAAITDLLGGEPWSHPCA